VVRGGGRGSVLGQATAAPCPPRGDDGGGDRPWILALAEVRRCYGFWPYGGSVGGLCGADLYNSLELHPAMSWGGAATGENKAPTTVMADDGGYTRHYLVKGIVLEDFIFLLRLL
jgi:hypothetical protein